MTKDSTNQAAPETASFESTHPERRNRNLWIAVAGVGVLWLQFLAYLRYNWSPESSYNYGWLVPPLAILLLYTRVQEPHPAGKDQQHIRRTHTSYLILAIAILLFALSCIAIELNPYWRLPLWIAGIALVTASLTVPFQAGGFPLVRKSAFPLVFALTMIPWPRGFEKSVIDTFTGFVTNVSVASLQIIGQPAEKFGHIIQIGATSVGVEEACSGIRSLQGLAMLALFIGGFLNLKTSGRIWLLALSLCLAIFFNLIRSVTLSLIAINGGDESFDSWHDKLGYLAFGIGLLTLLGVASQMSTKRRAVSPLPAAAKPGLPAHYSYATLAFAFAPILIVKTWYAEPPQDDASKTSWIVDVEGYATDAVDVVKLPIHKRIEEALGYDYGHHFAATNSRNNIATEVWYYGYHEDSKGKSLSAYGHSPLFCMTASGASLLEKQSPLLVDLGALTIPFHHFVFRLPNGQQSQVFWCLWDDLLKGAPESATSQFRLSQLYSVLERKRSFKRKVALLGVPTDDPILARNEIRTLARDLFLLQKDDKTFRFR
ncbi:exosortase/archaeosortase family protein [Pelagicoccus sp. SDUM812005]|uniref:exosortase/archaeosortase family protein n=1 Tax=Pelagicoccus sp. SDUM812005 TaxID=3041257 RepID=UPI00280EA178|nr:exosortase/archaeosortase family protein [Pelagicoccus sp. SDUM812005]MDQ8183720.1 exosortase/archaeosortase family protein [Pelagicoccus sp. SDUM812005]